MFKHPLSFFLLFFLRQSLTEHPPASASPADTATPGFSCGCWGSVGVGLTLGQCSTEPLALPLLNRQHTRTNTSLLNWHLSPELSKLKFVPPPHCLSWGPMPTWVNHGGSPKLVTNNIRISNTPRPLPEAHNENGFPVILHINHQSGRNSIAGPSQSRSPGKAFKPGMLAGTRAQG